MQSDSGDAHEFTLNTSQRIRFNDLELQAIKADKPADGLGPSSFRQALRLHNEHRIQPANHGTGFALRHVF